MRLKDRDFVETIEGFLFCIVGYLHPPDKYTAYLKYVPSKNGKWGESVKYRRVLEYYHALKVYETMAFLEKNYPHYVHHCPVRNIKISMVPREMIKKVYRSQERLREIMSSEKRDSLEEEVVQLVDRLSRIAGIPVENFGVTGSILTKIHNPKFSDIDLTIYGTKESFIVKESLQSLSEDPLVKKLPKEKLREWAQKISKYYNLPAKDAEAVARRRWNYGFFGKRYFSIHPVRKDEEITKSYGDEYYYPEGVVEGECVIKDVSESLFLPAIYKIENIKGLQFNIEEIVSFEGLFSGILEEGEKAKFKGKLERVETIKGKTYYRVVVGTAEVKDNYIVPVV